MPTVLMTPEGKRVVVSVKTDLELYAAPRNPPNTGTGYTTGTDLHYHKSRNDNDYFYLYHWSMWQGSGNSYELISKQEAIDFMLEKMGGIDDGWYRPSEQEIQRCNELGFDLLTETA